MEEGHNVPTDSAEDPKRMMTTSRADHLEAALRSPICQDAFLSSSRISLPGTGIYPDGAALGAASGDKVDVVGLSPFLNSILRFSLFASMVPLATAFVTKVWATGAFVPAQK